MGVRSGEATPPATSRRASPWRARLLWRRGLPVLNLALQGGGAHGAFTWGVLDRLLQAKGFRFEGISGASAGAINAVVMASGWLAGGPDGARAALEKLWQEVAAAGRLSPLRAAGLSQMAADFASQLLSPYQLNPFDLNPLRSILERLVDFERLRRDRSLALFVAATHLRSGGLRIFHNAELSCEVVLASACLPQLHHAVEIEGEPYWDGALCSNPPVLPVVEQCRARDLLLVQINPLAAGAVPTSARQIRHRFAEIVFGRPLESELESLARLARLTRSPLTWWTPANRRLARHRLHRIDGSAELAALDPGTRIDPDWSLLMRLRDMGRLATDEWLAGRPGRPAEAAASPAGYAPLPASTSPIASSRMSSA